MIKLNYQFYRISLDYFNLKPITSPVSKTQIKFMRNYRNWNPIL